MKYMRIMLKSWLMIAVTAVLGTACHRAKSSALRDESAQASGLYDLAAEQATNDRANGRWTKSWNLGDRSAPTSFLGQVMSEAFSDHYQLSEFSLTYDSKSGSLNTQFRYNSLLPTSPKGPRTFILRNENNRNSAQNKLSFSSDALQSLRSFSFVSQAGVAVSLATTLGVAAVVGGFLGLLPAAGLAYGAVGVMVSSPIGQYYEQNAVIDGQLVDASAAIATDMQMIDETRSMLDGIIADHPEAGYLKTIYERKYHQAQLRLAVAALMKSPARTVPLGIKGNSLANVGLVTTSNPDINKLSDEPTEFVHITDGDGIYKLSVNSSMAVQISYANLNPNAPRWAFVNPLAQTQLIGPKGPACSIGCFESAASWSNWHTNNLHQFNAALTQLSATLGGNWASEAPELSTVLDLLKQTMADIVAPLPPKAPELTKIADDQEPIKAADYANLVDEVKPIDRAAGDALVQAIEGAGSEVSSAGSSGAADASSATDRSDVSSFESDTDAHNASAGEGSAASPSGRR